MFYDIILQVFTDELYASGVDLAMKSTVRALQGTDKQAYMYKFDYRSERDDPDTYWMGKCNLLIVHLLHTNVSYNRKYGPLCCNKLTCIHSTKFYTKVESSTHSNQFSCDECSACEHCN